MKLPIHVDPAKLPVGALVQLNLPDDTYYYLIEEGERNEPVDLGGIDLVEEGERMRPLRAYIRPDSLPFDAQTWTFGFLSIFPSRRLA